MPPPKSKPLIDLNRLLSLIGVLISALAVLFLVYYLPAEIKSQIYDRTNPINEKIARIESKGESTDQRLARIEAILDGFVKPTLSKESLSGALKEMTTTDDPKKLKASLPVAQDLLKTAQAQGIVLKPEQVRDIAVPLVDKIRSRPELQPIAWETVSQFAAYRSYINEQVFPANFKRGTLPSTAPKFSNNLSIGGRYSLDNLDINGDVYIGSVIIYNGGPVSLENVRFDRCVFHVVATESGAKFMKALFLSIGPTVSL